MQLSLIKMNKWKSIAAFFLQRQIGAKMIDHGFKRPIEVKGEDDEK